MKEKEARAKFRQVILFYIYDTTFSCITHNALCPFKLLNGAFGADETRLDGLAVVGFERSIVFPVRCEVTSFCFTAPNPAL